MSTAIESRDRLIDILSLSYLGDLLREQLGDDAENYTWPDDFEKAVADIGFNGIVYRGQTQPYEALVFGNGLKPRSKKLSGYTSDSKIWKVRFYGDVKAIPPYGLNAETMLTDVVLPDGLVSIEAYAFALSGITEIEFPDSLTTLFDYAFNGTKLTRINTNKVTTMIGYATFGSCTALTTAELPEVTGELPYQCFINCTALKSVHIPKCSSVVGISSGQNFMNCTSLEDCILGSVGYPVTAIGTATFSNCKQSGLVITVYTASTYLNAVLTNIRNGATNATIIIKAAADMEYNGTTYQAGDTVLTSTP